MPSRACRGARASRTVPAPATGREPPVRAIFSSLCDLRDRGRPPNRLKQQNKATRRRRDALMSSHSRYPLLQRERRGRCLKLIDSCITQRKAQGPSRTCVESKEEAKRRRGRRLITCCRSGWGLKEREREFFIDNLLVRIHLSIEMILPDTVCTRKCGISQVEWGARLEGDFALAFERCGGREREVHLDPKERGLFQGPN